MCLYIVVYINIILENYVKKEISIQICNAMNASEACHWMLMRKCLLAMRILMLVIMILTLILLKLNTGYADTDADLYISITSCAVHKKAQGLHVH